MNHRQSDSIPVSTVIPTLNAEAFLPGCLESLVRARPSEILVIDGGSTDATIEIASRYGTKILRERTVGPGAARNHGVLAATFPLVFLMDSDIIVSPGSLTSLIDEFRLGNYEAIQSRLNSISAGSGYWGRALAAHHHLGKADNEWFGFSATLAQRDLLVRHPFDGELVSGEDMELARRFARAGIRVGVARKTTVVHRLGDKFENARKQWLDDGRGIASVMMLEGMRSAWMAAVPAAAAVRGIALSVLRAEPQWIPYYFGLAFFNMVGIGREVADVART